MYMRMLEYILHQLNKPMNYKSSIIPMLDSIKNSLLGRVHYPHTHFIETGAHSITLVTHGAPSLEQSNL
jgi:hypothetical protein